MPVEPLQLKRTTKGTLQDGEPFVDKTNEKLIIKMGSDEQDFQPNRKVRYIFKHVKVVGTIASPDTFQLDSAVTQLLNVTQTLYTDEGWTGDQITTETFSALGGGNNYAGFPFSILIIPEQEEQIVHIYDGTYPRIFIASSRVEFKLGRNQIGGGYGGGANAYCTIIIEKLF